MLKNMTISPLIPFSHHQSVPPDISDEQSSSDMTVREGGNVTFFCKATGHPTPKVTWRRDDGSPLYQQRNGTELRRGMYLFS